MNRQERLFYRAMEARSASAMLGSAIPAIGLACIAAAAGCGERESSATDPEAPPEAPIVTDDRDDLVLSWFADGGAHVAGSVSEVPEGSRREVRIQDPAVSPEERDPDWVFLADLTAKGPDGRYPVRAEPRATYESRRRPERPAEAPGPAPPSAAEGAPADGAAVVMYSNRHCPVCQKARRWLLEKGIPYRERDVELDPEAARDLATAAAAQGVPATGVPVFEIGSRLYPGFDPSAILKALSGAAPAARGSIAI